MQLRSENLTNGIDIFFFKTCAKFNDDKRKNTYLILFLNTENTIVRT